MKFSKIEDEQRKYNKHLHSVLIKHEIINNLEGNTFSQETSRTNDRTSGTSPIVYK